jgi:SlyX protein
VSPDVKDTDAHLRLQSAEQRLEQLEIKASYSDDLLDTLNTLVAEQQQHIDWLLREVAHLRKQAADSGPGTFRSLREEAPPHY